MSTPKSSSSSSSRRLPLKTRLFLATITFATRTACRSNYTINRSFMKIFDHKASPSAEPINGVSSFDITIDPNNNLWFRLYVPTSTSGSTASYIDIGLPCIVYFHGGGFCFFGADSKYFDQFCRRLAREIPSAVISINYRLAPEYKCPSQYEDGFDSLRFIDGMNFENFKAKVDLEWCFLAGDSAGGNLAHHIAIKASDYKFTNLDVIGVINIQPFFGGEERTESEIKYAGTLGLSVERTDWYWKAFLPEGADRDHPDANIFGPAGVDISVVDYPVTIIFIGGCDVLQDWQRRYYQGLKRNGKQVYLVEYPNVVHGFYLMPELAESSVMINEIRDFMEKQIKF